MRIRILSLAVAALLLTAGATACGTEPAGPPPPPKPAASIVYVPGETFAKDGTSVHDGRVIIVFVSDHATMPQIRRLGRRIGAMRVVEQYAFMSKEAVLRYFGYPLGYDYPPDWVPPDESPSAGFWLLLERADQVPAVTSALYDDPALARSGVSYVGVRLASDFYAHAGKLLVNHAPSK